MSRSAWVYVSAWVSLYVSASAWVSVSVSAWVSVSVSAWVYVDVYVMFPRLSVVPTDSALG